MASFSARFPKAVADDYVSTRPKSRPVSISQALRAIRAVLPNCQLTDRQLEDLVARAAIKSGLTIHFDLNPEPSIVAQPATPDGSAAGPHPYRP